MLRNMYELSAHVNASRATPLPCGSTAGIRPGVGAAADAVVLQELGLLLHDRGEVAVPVAGDVAVSETVTDLVVDQHLPVGVDLAVAVGLRALGPPVGVDHHALGGGRVAGDVVHGGVQTRLGTPLG